MKPITYFKVNLWEHIPESVCKNLIKKYKGNKRDYYHVVIFDSFEDMYAYGDRYFGEKIEHNYSGICKYLSSTYYEDGVYVDIDKKCGWILFCREELGTGTISHECTHAVTFYFQYRISNCYKVFNNEEYNELLAYMIGSLVTQIYKKLYEKKVF